MRDIRVNSFQYSFLNRRPITRTSSQHTECWQLFAERSQALRGLRAFGTAFADSVQSDRRGRGRARQIPVSPLGDRAGLIDRARPLPPGPGDRQVGKKAIQHIDRKQLS